MNKSQGFPKAVCCNSCKYLLFLTQKKAQTKYIALNINDKITIDQRKVLERVFDVISKEYESNIAEGFIDTILRCF